MNEIGETTKILSKPFYEILVCFFFSLTIFLLSIISSDFLENGSKMAIFAKEMFEDGISFFPKIYGEYYPRFSFLSLLPTYIL